MPQVREVIVAVLLLSSGLLAQSPAPSDQAAIAQLVQEVKALQQETSELRERVRALEGEKSAAAPTNPETTTSSQEAAQSSAPTPAVADVPAPLPGFHEQRGIQWRGFGELNYKALDRRKPELGTYGFDPGSAANFYTGDFGLFLNSNLSGKASALGEIVFEEGNAQSFSVDIRRLLLKYDWNDHFKISLGRYQTGIGYYNWAFRSAAWLQTAADRPLIMEYSRNGGLLPTQAVGISATGSVPSGNFGLNYLAEYGTSNTVRPDTNGSGLLDDEDDGNHVLVGLFARPLNLPGIQIGASFFHDQIADNRPGEVSERFGQSIVNAYVVYTGRALELLNEGFLIRHLQLDGPDRFNMPAFYSQISRQFGRFRPFVRYQYINANQGSIFEDVQLRHGPSGGVRYDFNDYIAFKAQLDHIFRKARDDIDGLHLQLSFTF